MVGIAFDGCRLNFQGLLSYSCRPQIRTAIQRCSARDSNGLTNLPKRLFGKILVASYGEIGMWVGDKSVWLDCLIRMANPSAEQNETSEVLTRTDFRFHF